ncbi:MAG: tRNA pseudouridine(55) synthase TruB [Candidatus Omnitrophica bacterium]|nr:tRNA pseudouridine(55) synthase TruB [Candidatus Omnitrophota bacterium]
MKNAEKIEGILLVDKPQGWTSHDVCHFVRKRFQIKKVGHAGTLDPLATGLLVLLIGQATKSSQPLSASDKTYQGVLELGVATDSHDRQGKVLQEAAWEHVTLEEIRAKAKSFTGSIIQVPPMVSALKRQGRRLYELSRRGITVPREGRPITVYEWSFQKKDGKFVHFFASVSKGTYLRTLVHDLGESLGTLAALAELRRLACGNFSLEDAVTVDSLKAFSLEELSKHILPLSRFSFHAASPTA